MVHLSLLDLFVFAGIYFNLPVVYHLLLTVLGLQSRFCSLIFLFPHLSNMFGDLCDTQSRIVFLYFIIDFSPVQKESSEGFLELTCRLIGHWRQDEQEGSAMNLQGDALYKYRLIRAINQLLLYLSSQWINFYISNLFPINYQTASYYIIKLTNNYSQMQPKSNVRFHELKPNKKPSDSQIFNLTPDETDDQINVLQSSSRKHRNQSVSEIKNNQPIRESVGSKYSKDSDYDERSKLGESFKLTKQEDTKSKRQIVRLREKLGLLQNDNICLHKLNIQLQSEVKIWSDKAKRLNQELINYENNELTKIDLSCNTEFYKRQMMLKDEQIRQLKMSRFDYQQSNRQLLSKMQEISLELQKSRKDVIRLRQIEAGLGKVEELRLLDKQELKKMEYKNKKNELYIQQLENQIEQNNNKRNNQISAMEDQKLTNLKREKDQFEKELHKVIKQLNQLQSQKEVLNLKVTELHQANQEKYTNQSNNQIIKLNQSNQQLALKLLQTNEELNKSHRLIEQFKLQITKQKLAKVSSVQQSTSKEQSLQQRYNEIEYMTDRIRQQKKKEIQKLQQEHVKQKEKLTAQIQSLKLKYKNIKNELEQSGGKNESKEAGYKSKIQQLERIIESFNNEMKESSLISHKQRQIYDRKCRQYKEVQYAMNVLTTQYNQIQQEKTVLLSTTHNLDIQLRQTNQSRQQLQQSHDQTQNQLLQRIKENQYSIRELAIQNQKWKSYRMSEEDQARRETRKYKKRVEELQSIFNQQHKQNKLLIEELQQTNEQLRRRILGKQKQTAELLQKQLNLYNRQLQQEKAQFNSAMDEMEIEFKRLLAECEFKLKDKQNSIDQLNLQLQNISTTIQDKEYFKTENETLKKELATVQNELNSLTHNIKRFQEQNRTIRQGSQSQRDYKLRYDKNIQEKVKQIQRLKLQINDLQQDFRRNSNYKKQLQSLELILRNKEREDSQNAERMRHLQKMIDNSENQIKAYKSVKQELMAEMKTLQSEAMRTHNLARTIEQLQYDLGQQRAKASRHLQQKVKQSKDIDEKNKKMLQLEHSLSESHNNSKKWIQKYDKLQKQTDHHKDSLRSSVLKQQQLINSIREHQQKLNDMISQTGNFERQLNALKEYKKKYLLLQDQQVKDKQLGRDQQQMIQNISKEQAEKTEEIRILLSKIDLLQKQNLLNLSKLSQNVDNSNKTKFEYYQKIATLIGKIDYEGDEELYLKSLYEAIRLMISKHTDLAKQMAVKEKMISFLGEEKENLNCKYMKYKAAALEYKDKKQMQKLIIRNNYRFNEEVLTHCQSIIKGSQTARM